MPEGSLGRGSHFELIEPGPYAFPDLVQYERIDNLARRIDNLGHLSVLLAFTAGKQRLLIPISNLAAESLLTAPEKEVPFAVPTGVRPLVTGEMIDPVEMPLLGQFVCFRLISPEWRICEFMNEKDQRLLAPFSTKTYRAVLNGLKRIKARKSIPASAFAGSEVLLGQDSPCYERPLTDQEAVEMGAKILGYRSGIEPEKFLWVWSQSDFIRVALREKARRVLRKRNPNGIGEMSGPQAA